MKVLGIFHRVRSIRCREGMSQTEAGALAGVSRSTWSTYERGLSVPSVATMVLFARSVSAHNSLAGDVLPFILDDSRASKDGYNGDSVSGRLKSARRLSHSTILSASVAAIVAQSTVYQYETGVVAPPVRVTIALASHYQVASSWLAGFGESSC